MHAEKEATANCTSEISSQIEAKLLILRATILPKIKSDEIY